MVEAGDPPEVRENRRVAHLVCGATGVLPGLVVGVILGLVVGPVAGVVAGVVVLVAVGVGVWRGATAYTLSVVGARAPRPSELPRLANLVDGLCATFGVPTPEILVVDDPVANALTVGPGPPARPSWWSPPGFWAPRADRDRGVVAHELAHVKAHDTVRAGVAVVALAPLTLLGRTDGLLHVLVGRGRESGPTRRRRPPFATRRAWPTRCPRWRPVPGRSPVRSSPVAAGWPPGGCGSTPWPGSPTVTPTPPVSSMPPRSAWPPWPSGDRGPGVASTARGRTPGRIG